MEFSLESTEQCLPICIMPPAYKKKLTSCEKAEIRIRRPDSILHTI